MHRDVWAYANDSRIRVLHCSCFVGFLTEQPERNCFKGSRIQFFSHCFVSSFCLILNPFYFLFLFLVISFLHALYINHENSTDCNFHSFQNMNQAKGNDMSMMI